MKLESLCNPEYFKDDLRGYATPNQLRDRIIETVYFSFKDTIPDFGKVVADLRNLANEENKRREGLPEKYVKCVHCKGYHDQLNNIDQLCEKCEATTAPFRYDKTHGLVWKQT